MRLNRTAFQNIVEAQGRNPICSQLPLKSLVTDYVRVLLNPLLIRTTKDRLTKTQFIDMPDLYKWEKFNVTKKWRNMV